MTAGDRRAELHGKIDQLQPPEVVVVDQFVDAILGTVEYELTPGSWLTIPAWADTFLARLRSHHALNSNPLMTDAFEEAFNAACEAADWAVSPTVSATHRFYDTTITIPGQGDRQFSLKTTAAKSMSRSSVHISKLTEAAWIQDERTKKGRRDKIVELFTEYQQETDSIIVFRCFRDRPDVFRYQLVEIPTTLFVSIKSLSVEEAQASTIPIPPKTRTPDARIRIDRSDAKISVTGIRIELCVIHGYWTIPDTHKSSQSFTSRSSG